MLYVYYRLCLIVFDKSRESETWITFLRFFSKFHFKNVQSHIFGLSKNVKNTLEHCLPASTDVPQ